MSAVLTLQYREALENNDRLIGSLEWQIAPRRPHPRSTNGTFHRGALLVL